MTTKTPSIIDFVLDHQGDAAHPRPSNEISPSPEECQEPRKSIEDIEAELAEMTAALENREREEEDELMQEEEVYRIQDMSAQHQQELDEIDKELEQIDNQDRLAHQSLDFHLSPSMLFD
ncbi:uncharacterized protein LOC107042099 [Diachasma alloeum]|uniref:uncharacterized protein LOC107042099 n=1 Tax=Diachasma alloeum TaxID=454923 RepID=UPI0007383D55|nr:uncharacterized protein LOC107042099 [Diachasma alloeum]